MNSWRGCKPFWSNRAEVVMLDDKTSQSAVARVVAAATSPSPDAGRDLVQATEERRALGSLAIVYNSYIIPNNVTCLEAV